MAQRILLALQQHLQALISDPAHTPIDKKLCEQAELVLHDQEDPRVLLDVIKTAAAALQVLQEDPSPLTNLIQALLKPFTFSDVLAFDQPIDFISGLAINEHLVAVNKLMLSLLDKATAPSDVSTIANNRDLVQAIINLWLQSSDTGVAAQAGALMLSLLTTDRVIIQDVDKLINAPGSGHGLLWKRVFTDKDIYESIFRQTDLKTSGSGKRLTSLSQSRLLEVLPAMAILDWESVTKSHFPDVEKAHGVTEGGLMSFAVAHMIDSDEDLLTYCVLIEFCSQLLKSTEGTTADAHARDTPLGLQYLTVHGLHDRISELYLAREESNPLEHYFLHSYAARYFATYVSLCPQHYLTSPHRPRVNARLREVLDRSSESFSHRQSPTSDLNVLASLPRVSLLPGGNGTGDWKSSVLALLPSRTTNADVLNVLATIFHGPESEMLTVPPRPTMMADNLNAQEAAVARALYLHYLANNRLFWSDVVKHADTVALVDTALAAIRILCSVITANWGTSSELSLPTTAIPTPETGVLAILSPPALEYALPYLMSPPKLFSNLVGGRGDAESAAYKVAMAKHEALTLFQKRLALHIQQNRDSGFDEVLATIEKRLAEGPMAPSNEVGGRVATLEL